MTAPFRLYGAELSPYSVKVRSYLRYKGVEFDWVPRTNARQEEFQRYAKLPLIPVLVDADEWLNKAMFHYRWSYPEDQESAAKRISDMIFEGAEKPEGIEEQVRTRMIGRLYHVGSSPETAELIEGSFTRLLSLLNGLLAKRKYLFGGRPSLADFGLAGQLAQLRSDPTPGTLLEAQAPNVVRWLDRMESPKAEGKFASFADVRDEVAELLRAEIAGAYLLWMDANARAVSDDASGVSVDIAGTTFVQKPQRYAAKAFSELKRKRGLVEDSALATLLAETGVDALLASSARDDDNAGSEDDADGDDESDEGEE
jgi:glutathione S-transferase